MCKMKRLLSVTLVLILTSIVLSGCASFRVVKKDNFSIVAISAISYGFLQKGYGITVTLENIDTQERLISKPLSPVSSHSIVQNIPPGKYFVQKIEVPVGSFAYLNWSEDVKDFFGTITIEANSKYYLGNFAGTRKMGRQNVLSLRIDDQNIPELLKQKIEAEKTGWKTGPFTKLYPYKKDELMVY